MSPAVAYGANTCRVPTMVSSTKSGATIACRRSQRARSAGNVARVDDPRRTLLDRDRGQPRRLLGVVGAGAVPGEQAGVPVSAAAGVPSRVRRCLMLRSALVWVSPARSAGEANEAVWRVRNVARSASVPRWARRNLGHGVMIPDRSHAAGRLSSDDQRKSISSMSGSSPGPLSGSGLSPPRWPPRTVVR